MKKKILCLLLSLMIVSITAFTPILGASCSYVSIASATEETEELTDDEIIQAGISTFLNARKGYIVNIIGLDVQSVKNIMQLYIDSIDLWKNSFYGDKTELVASIIIRYNPFRVSLKGNAVRAFNDLFDWLVETGKLSNLENSNGGETTDNLYTGKSVGTGLFYYFSRTYTAPALGGVAPNYVTLGTAVDNMSPDLIYSLCKIDNPSLTMGNEYIDNFNTRNITIRYAADVVETVTTGLQNSGGNFGSSFLPYIYIKTASFAIWGDSNKVIRGYPAWYKITSEAANISHYGVICYNATDKVYYYREMGTYQDNNITGLNDVSVNFYSDDFEKTNPTPPENDEEITYTPSDKDTGNTYNTFNQYITNYVQKKTVINNNNSGGGNDPGGGNNPSTPGGESPPWDNSGTAGTLTPDGNGGYDLSLPDITIPDLDINWSISGLTEKFPFSIPFDLLAFFTVLNAQPETPKIEGTIDLGIVDWEIDWDLHAFDTLAALLRNLEFIGFCIALILITRNLIKG